MCVRSARNSPRRITILLGIFCIFIVPNVFALLKEKQEQGKDKGKGDGGKGRARGAGRGGKQAARRAGNPEKGQDGGRDGQGRSSKQT